MLNFIASEPPRNFFDQICHLEYPEDLFGPLGVTPTEQMGGLENRFKTFIKAYHPDKFVGQPLDQYYATEISKLIIELKQRAKGKIKCGSYGKVTAPDPLDCTSVIHTDLREYNVTDLWVEGKFTDIYRARYPDPASTLHPWKDVVIKIIADAAHNPLVENEIEFYQTMAHFSLPEFVDEFRTPDRKQAIILGYIAGGYDLIELKQRYQTRCRTPGLSQEHMVWMLERFLTTLGLLHNQHIIHGDIQPDNLLVQPETHKGFLIDFLHCRMTPGADDTLEAVNPSYCAPEVLSRRFRPHPVADIYALGKCMIYLLGGNGASLDDSIQLDVRLRYFLHKMILPDPFHRAADAWELAEELSHLRQQCFGAAHQFISLEIGG